MVAFGSRCHFILGTYYILVKVDHDLKPVLFGLEECLDCVIQERLVVNASNINNVLGSTSKNANANASLLFQPSMPPFFLPHDGITPLFPTAFDFALWVHKENLRSLVFNGFPGDNPPNHAKPPVPKPS